MSTAGRKCWWYAAVAAVGCGCGCGASPSTSRVVVVTESQPATTAVRQGMGKRPVSAPPIELLSPSRLVAEIDEEVTNPWLELAGQSLFIAAGLRFVRQSHGLLERSMDRFPSGDVQAIDLPHRLGGGYLFFQSSGQGARLWRAAEWTGKLRPLARLAEGVSEVIAGFDRIYLRSSTGQLVAIDPDGGQLLSLGGLPRAGAYGSMAFADGWRGVVNTDLRGPLASFDAGASWHPVPFSERPVSAAVVGGDPVFFVSGGRYRVDSEGHLQHVIDGGQDDEDEDEEGVERSVPPQPLGERPLRVAVERGWPDSQTTAVVGYHGVLARVRLRDGAVVAARRGLLDGEQTVCQGARVGKGFGFVCGSSGADTVIYAFAPPLALREVARFKGPRFVAPSGNGALVVRGGCGGEAVTSAASGTLSYCVIATDGGATEIHVKGKLGSERLVALEDGRVVVLIPPRRSNPGRLNLISGATVTSSDLRYPPGPKRALTLVRQGLWVDGFQQRSAKSVGGWVEAGGPVIGVTVSLDGRVQFGDIEDQGSGVLLSGRRALAVTDAEVAFESTDGGQHWNEIELPELPESRGDDPTRGCSPVGCALRGWLRVGWGETARKDDLADAPEPKAIAARHEMGQPLRLSCKLVEPASAEAQGVRYAARVKWSAFRGVPPPSLRAGEVGIDKGSEVYEKVPARAYVWGPKGADWTRAGWWQLRFDNRFHAGPGVIQSAPTRPPWADEASAADAIGAHRRGSYWRWSAALDPGGRSAIVTSCMGSRCRPFAVTDGRPIVPLLTSAMVSALSRPQPFHVVRLADNWYLLRAQGPQLSLWRAQSGSLRKVTDLWRLGHRHGLAVPVPRLVRRAFGHRLGLLVTVPPDPGASTWVGHWMVLPVDERSGEIGEPIDLGPTDLGGVVPARCGAHDAGWQIIVQPSMPPVLRLLGVHGYLDNVELSLRHNPGGACIEAMAARSGRSLQVGGAPGGPGGTMVGAIPLSVTGRSDGRRWRLVCGG